MLPLLTRSISFRSPLLNITDNLWVFIKLNANKSSNGDDFSTFLDRKFIWIVASEEGKRHYKINNLKEKWLIAKCCCFDKTVFAIQFNIFNWENTHTHTQIYTHRKSVCCVSGRLTIGLSNGKTGTNSISISGVFLFSFSFLVYSFPFSFSHHKHNDLAVSPTLMPCHPAMYSHKHVIFWFLQFLVVYYIVPSIKQQTKNQSFVAS